jgi:hypothetical protein
MATTEKPQEKPEKIGTYKQYRRALFDHALHFDRWHNAGGSDTSFVQVYEKEKTQAYVKSITRQGDTIYVVSLSNECVEVPYSRCVSAVILTTEDHKDISEFSRVRSPRERELAKRPPETPAAYVVPTPGMSLAFGGSVAGSNLQ